MNFFDMIQDEAAFGLPSGNRQTIPAIPPFYENSSNFRLIGKNKFTIPDSFHVGNPESCFLTDQSSVRGSGSVLFPPALTIT